MSGKIGIRPEVLEFARAMSKRLDENEHKSKIRHWIKIDDDELVRRARHNLLSTNCNPVDAGNYCMMLFDNAVAFARFLNGRGGRTKP